MNNNKRELIVNNYDGFPVFDQEYLEQRIMEIEELFALAKEREAEFRKELLELMQSCGILKAQLKFYTLSQTDGKLRITKTTKKKVN